ncbi:MAG: DUF368 domain-containing protein [Acholeplasma sp.]|nr:DUF368 domain-containing protein [Acholeplasma sp.]
MNRLFEIIKGSFIGLANIIPGVSGGTMAVIFKLYDKLITAIADFPKQPLQSIKDLFFILLGALIGIIVGVFVIAYFYTKLPFVTTLVFVGFIIGGLKPIYKEVSGFYYKTPYWLGFLIAIVIIVGLPMMSSNMQIQTGFIYYIVLLLIGALTAVTMIVPGVSGSMVLLVIGYYTHVLELAKSFITAFLNFDLEALLDLLIPVFLLGIGFVLGGILFSKLTKWVIIRYKNMFYTIVFGLVLSSPVAIIYILNQSNPILNTKLSEVFIGLILMIGAAYLAHAIIVKSENKKSQASERKH